MSRQQELLELHYNKLVKQTTLPTGDQPSGTDALKSIIADTELSVVFFSEKNMTLLLNAIRYEVYKDTGKIIGQQSKYDLLMVMRSIYLQYTDNRDTSQIPYLNSMVLDFCVKTVTTGMYQHLQYMSEIGRNPLPMARSQLSTTNNRTEVQGRKVSL